MPLDNRRINGPENTVPYRLYTILNTKSFNQRLDDAILSNGKRSDKRKMLEHRKFFIKTGAVSQAKGSAYMEVGNTKVVVSVFDPREIPNRTEYTQKGELYCEFKYATFSCPQRRMYQMDAEEKQNSNIFKQALEPAVCLHEFPNFQVDIYALVLENDGSALSTAITCASAALAHAGVPMFELVTSVTLGIIDNKFLIDPNLNEEQLCNITQQKTTEHGVIVYAALSTHQQVSQFYQTGNVSYDNINETIKILADVNKEILPLVEKCLVKYVLKNNTKGDIEL